MSHPFLMEAETRHNWNFSISNYSKLAIIQSGCDLTDEQWCVVRTLIEEFHTRDDPRGRPPVSRRAVLDGILWKLVHMKKAWAALPGRYPTYQTCHRYFKCWRDSGLLLAILTTLFGETGKSPVSPSMIRTLKAATPAANSPVSVFHT